MRKLEKVDTFSCKIVKVVTHTPIAQVKIVLSGVRDMHQPVLMLARLSQDRLHEGQLIMLLEMNNLTGVSITLFSQEAEYSFSQRFETERANRQVSNFGEPGFSRSTL